MLFPHAIATGPVAPLVVEVSVWEDKSMARIPILPWLSGLLSNKRYPVIPLLFISSVTLTNWPYVAVLTSVKVVEFVFTKATVPLVTILIG